MIVALDDSSISANIAHRRTTPAFNIAMNDPLPIRAVHHVGRLTKQLNASRDFYREVLGFQEIPRPPFAFGGAWLTAYGVQIHLIVDESIAHASGAIESRTNHLAFEVSDTDEVERRLQAHQVMYRVSHQTGTGLKQIFFHDPDGHTIECAAYSSQPAAVEPSP